jgi:hypothetical protein
VNGEQVLGRADEAVGGGAGLSAVGRGPGFDGGFGQIMHAH